MWCSCRIHFRTFGWMLTWRVMTDHLFPERDLWDPRWRDEEHVNTGFMFARASHRSLQLVHDFIRAHHSPWDAQTLGGGIFDLFDQRIFSSFLRRRLESGECVSHMENLTYGSRWRSPSGQSGEWSENPSIRVLHPDVIAHGGSFFWLRSWRRRHLEAPPVAHANFGRNKQYFLRDRGLWFIENLTERFREPVQYDEYYPPALLPEEQDETIRVDDENDTWRFLLYEPRGTSTCSTWNLDPLACQFLDLAAALEVAVLLKRRLVLPDAFDCSLLPMWDAYGMSSTFQTPHEGCTFDYFADAEGFTKRFGHLLVEAGLKKSPDFLRLQKASAHLGRASDCQDLPLARAFGPAVLEVLDNVVTLRDHLRQLDGRGLDRHLFPCRWVEMDTESYARRAGDAPRPRLLRARSGLLRGVPRLGGEVGILHQHLLAISL
ncbi:unnamed protein product [Durusdinium trenchii]|uniref:Nucleotide-diphospho-sugar transferase domain-containing protein n=1 Tax=Durusdinium trenchii TaxID=1381693 RepID=A0ABP0S2H3_9DINO